MSPQNAGVPAAGVLLVDDDGAMRTLIHRILEHHGIHVWEAGSGAEAVPLYSQRRAEVDLVLLDVQMAGMDGPQTLDALRRINPQVRCCFLMGDPGRYSHDELLRRGALRVLRKPFILAGVKKVLRIGSAPMFAESHSDQETAKKGTSLPNAGRD